MTDVDRPYSPYVGPRPFEPTEIDSRRFAGRNTEIQDIVSLLYGHPIVLVYGASGAGKTSIINAGVRHELEGRGFQVWPSARVKISAEDTQVDERVRNPYVFSALQTLHKHGDVELLKSQSIDGFLAEHRRIVGEPGPHTMHVLVFDQLEEIFTSPTERWLEGQTELFEQIAEAVQFSPSTSDAGSATTCGDDTLAGDPLLRVVLVIREEYLGQLETYARLLPEGLLVRYRLEPLTYSGAVEALSSPLPEPYAYDRGVADEIVKDLSRIRWGGGETPAHETTGRYVEPVQLQLVGESLWSHLPTGQTEITLDLYKQHGNVDEILRDYYEYAVKSFCAKKLVKEASLRQWFNYALITPAETRGIVFRGTQKTDGLPNEAVDALVDEHIIRGEERAGGRWYELSHDRWISPVKKSNREWVQKRAKRRETMAISSFFLTLIIVGTVFAALRIDALNLNPSIVPRPDDLTVDDFRGLPKPEYGQFHILRDLRVIDLRSRRKLRFWQTKHGGKHSPVTWLRYTQAQKKKKDATEMRFFFATTGFGVYPRSLTHAYTLERSVDNEKLFPDKNLTEVWHVVTDVAAEPVDEIFLVTTEATFWNGFQGEKEWASIDAIGEGTESIGVSMIFSEDNPYQTLAFVKHDLKTDEKIILKQNTPQERQVKTTDRWEGKNGEVYEVFLDKKGRTVFWLVNHPSTRFRYNVSWTWDQSN